MGLLHLGNDMLLDSVNLKKKAWMKKNVFEEIYHEKSKKTTCLSFSFLYKQS